MKSFRAGLFLLMLAGCAKGAGEIDISLDLSAVTNQGGIERFIIMVVDPSLASSRGTLLFPAECTGCSVSQDPCPAESVCLKSSACGFSAAEQEFRPKVSFADFPDGTDMSVVACALDGGQTVIGAGAKTVANTDGQSATISLQDSPDACNNNFPPACS